MRNHKAFAVLLLVLAVMLFSITACTTEGNHPQNNSEQESSELQSSELESSEQESSESESSELQSSEKESSEEESSEPESSEPETHVHAFGKATCTKPATCECGATEGEALGHKYESVVTAPTCDKEGYTIHTCTVCKDSYKDSEVDALGHKYESVVTAPTCTEGGYTTHTCTVCKDSYKDSEVESLGHKYEGVVTAPTCTEDGYTTHTCTVCKDSYKDSEVESLGHKYESVVTAPTCTEDGYTTHTCTVCKDSYKDTEVPALGHKYDSNGVCSGCEAELITVNPVVGKGYLFGMTQKNLQNKVYYLKGGMNGYYMETTTNPSEALFVYLEETEGGYYAYCFVGDVKTYINMTVSGTHVNGAYEATASTVYQIDEEHHTIIATVDGADYWFGTRNDKTYTTAGPCKTSFAGFYCEFYDAHIHNFVKGETVAPGCEAEGYTEYNCSCGATEKKDIVEAVGHIEGEWEVDTEATCTTEGKKVVKCQREGCGEVVKSETISMLEHTYVNGFCSCGKEDPDAHKHNYVPVVTAPTCTVKGYTTYTCACGDTYTGDETEVVPHVDSNLDITCDFEGCTKRILPEANSKVSLFTANHMIIVSLSSSYYVEGVVTEVVDAKSGIFVITDEAGDTILIRLPKNESGTAYASWTEHKVVLGDTIQVYGKPSRNSSSPTTQKAKVEGGVLTVLKHEHSFSEATCTEPSICGCLAIAHPELGHVDENGDNVCDRCPWKMNLTNSHITIATDPAVGGVFSADQTYWTWSNDEFDAIIAKGTSSSTVYKTSKAYMQLKKGNSFTLVNKNKVMMNSIIIYTTNATQLTNLSNAIGTAYEFTKDEEKLCVTITLSSTDDFAFSNVGTMTAYISGVDIIYEK